MGTRYHTKLADGYWMSSDTREGQEPSFTLLFMLPTFFPAFYMIYETWNTLRDTYHWHPLFMILACFAEFMVLFSLPGAFFMFAPRWLAGFTSGLFAAVAYGIISGMMTKDPIWIGTAVVVTFAIGCGIGIYVSMGLKQPPKQKAPKKSKRVEPAQSSTPYYIPGDGHANVEEMAADLGRFRKWDAA